MRQRASKICGCCGQPMPSQLRAGVYLPPLKARIFDTIQQNPGIALERVSLLCYGASDRACNIRVHVCQINDMLAATDTRVRLSGDGHGLRGCYRVVD
jgi:hypothetical protein